MYIIWVAYFSQTEKINTNNLIQRKVAIDKTKTNAVEIIFSIKKFVRVPAGTLRRKTHLVPDRKQTIFRGWL